MAKAKAAKGSAAGKSTQAGAKAKQRPPAETRPTVKKAPKAAARAAPKEARKVAAPKEARKVAAPKEAPRKVAAPKEAPRKATAPKEARKVVGKEQAARESAPPPASRPASTPAPPASTAAAAEAGAPGGEPNASSLRVKKKVKRGAPPMLPRRLTRRPLPAPPVEGAPVLPHKTTAAPGSLHAPVRAPEEAEKLKANLMAVMGDLARLRALKRTLHKQFWDAGMILAHLSEPTLYQAKGYGSWESFLEREIERELAIGRTTAVDLVRIVKVFQRDAAEELGLERLRGALRALWPEPGSAHSSTGSGGAEGM